MKIHEYQAKEILNKHNINTPKGFVASSLEESLNMAEKNRLSLCYKGTSTRGWSR